MEKPEISVVLPLYNSAATVVDVLESIRNLDYDTKNIEVLMIHYQLPSDKTTEVVSKYVEKHGSEFRTIKLISRRNKKANYARNLGIKRSKGNYILLLNDDIVLHPKAVKYAMEHLRNPETCAVTFPYMMNPPTLWEKVQFFRFLNKAKQTKVLNIGLSLVKKETFEKVGLIDEDLGPPISSNDDFEFSARIARKTKYKIIIEGKAPCIHIHNKKENKTTRKETTSTTGKLKKVLTWYINLLKYDLTVGADTYYLVLTRAPATWKLEALMYLIVPLLAASCVPANPIYAALMFTFFPALFAIYYKAFSFKNLAYAYLIIYRRMQRAICCALRIPYKILLRKFNRIK